MKFVYMYVYMKMYMYHVYVYPIIKAMMVTVGLLYPCLLGDISASCEDIKEIGFPQETGDTHCDFSPLDG